MSIGLTQFHATFLEEAAEHTATIEIGLLALDQGTTDPDVLHAIFRAAHSIKGGSGSVGFTEVAEFTHVLESVFDRLRDGRLRCTPELSSLLLEATDTLQSLLDAAQLGDPKKVRRADVTGRMERVLRGGNPGPRGSGGTPRDSVAPTLSPTLSRPERRLAIHLTPKPGAFAMGKDCFLLVREVCALGAVEQVDCDASRLPSFAELDPETCYLDWHIDLTTQAADRVFDELFRSVADMAVVVVKDLSGGGPAADRRASDVTSIRVATEKVDTLIDLVGQLVVSQTMVTQAAGQIPQGLYPALENAVAEAARRTRDLQEQVLAIRMQPVGTVFQRIPRLVRDLGDKLGKNITLDIVGAETELDKSALERLGDPLTHLIRNAVDHGLEAPHDRIRAGKAPQGTVRLRAGRDNDGVVIEIADDGRGLPVEKLRAQAVAKGVIDKDANLSIDDLHQLIFHPGLSTAAQVSQISGRGVGMDIVRTNVEALNGTITIGSSPGKGTTFRIFLPAPSVRPWRASSGAKPRR